MSHARTQIQDAMVIALDAGVTATVQSGRVWTYQQEELPIVGVYANDEEQSVDDGSFDAIGRNLELVCEIVAQAIDGATVNDALNVVATEIETTLGSQRQALGIMDCTPATWTVEVNSEAETVTAKALMGFEVLYRTAIGTPEVIL
jgi:hypothetical protein